MTRDKVIERLCKQTSEKLSVLSLIHTFGMSESLLVRFAVAFDVTLPRFYELLEQYDNGWQGR